MKSDSKSIAIIGGGIAGLVSAYRLLRLGHAVTVYEAGPQVGGQLATTAIDGIPIEHYYHHAFTSDTALWDLCRDLNIGHTVQWIPSTMGYYTHNTLYPFGTPSSLLRFHPLGILGRIQFVLSTLWIAFRMTRPQSEHHAAKQWFAHHGFKTAWHVIWEPLFRLKFGSDADTVSLTWLWGKLKTRGTSRQSGNKETLAYMSGSFKTLSDSLQSNIIQLGGTIHCNTAVTQLAPTAAGWTVNTQSVDAVIATVSSDAIATFPVWTADQQAHFLRYRYKAAICAMLVVTENPVPLYWINVGDPTIPFGGVIAHTNWVSPATYNGHHVIYLSRYLDESDALFTQDPAETLSVFIDGLVQMFPTFNRSQIIRSELFRQRNAQPIVPVGYTPPTITTPHPGLFWISTHHTYPYDRGINYAIECADQAVRSIVDQSGQSDIRLIQ